MDQGIMLSDSVFFPSGTNMAITMLVALVAAAALYLFVARPKLLFGRRGGNRHDRTLGLFLAVLCGTAVLIAPMLFILQEGDALASIPLLGIRLLQAVVLDNGFVDFMGGVPQGLLARAYYVLIGLGYVLLPLLAALNVYDIFAKRFDAFHLWRATHARVKRKSTYLFSGFNSVTFRIAKEAQLKDPDAVVIFGGMSKLESDTWSTEIAELDPDRSICLEVSYPEVALRLCSAFTFSNLSCFAVTDNTAQDIAVTCRAIGLLRGIDQLDSEKAVERCRAFAGEGGASARSRVRLFVTCNSLDDELVLDAANGDARVLAPEADASTVSDPLQLTLLNEATMAMFDLLKEAPLLDVLGNPKPGDNGLRPANPVTLNVVVLGSDAYAEEVLKGLLWCGQLYNVRLEAEVVSAQAHAFRDRVLVRCPDLQLQDCFSMEFTQLELQSPALERECLARYEGSEHLYIVSAIEDDALSFETAMRVRRYFIGRHAGSSVDVRHCPLVACLIRNEATSLRISAQFDEDVPSYGIVAFGCTAKLFSYENVLDSSFEKAGQRASDLYDAVYESIDGRLFAGEEVDVGALRECVHRALERELPQLGSQDARPYGIACARQIVHYSNLAQAIHARYKAWSACGAELSDEACVCLGEAEHDRWTMFYRTHGFTYLTPQEQEAYSRELCGKNTRHKIEPLRKHSLMCPNDEIWANYLHAKGGFSYVVPSALALSGAGAGARAAQSDAALSGAALSEFGLPDSGLPEGGACLQVSAVDASGAAVEGIAVQLLDEGYAVVEEWTSGASPHVTRKLPCGRYILHPASAMPGCECAADLVVEVPAAVGAAASAGAEGEAGALTFAMKVEGRALVNPVVYDWAFAIAAPQLLRYLD